ncbi:unnamed protein product, partial [Urochloa humidicola]
GKQWEERRLQEEDRFFTKRFTTGGQLGIPTTTAICRVSTTAAASCCIPNRAAAAAICCASTMDTACRGAPNRAAVLVAGIQWWDSWRGNYFSLLQQPHFPPLPQQLGENSHYISSTSTTTQKVTKGQH